jgi:unsaturated chondroitin disaccharide hydrolase
MLEIDARLEAADLLDAVQRLWKASAVKIRSIEKAFDPARGAPVFTVDGVYTSRGWTEWTEGFQFGSAILQFDATGDEGFLELGRRRTLERMAMHVTHAGVHDHGFNNCSTYGNLLRLLHEGRIPHDAWERRFYRLALRCSGATQARRWTPVPGGLGYIYSFNGPHSLFVDTLRSLRVLACAHRLGHALADENDTRVSLLERLVAHARTTARYSVYYGEGRDAYDVRGRVAHESIFNVNDGNYRCPGTQQGYSPFTTWTRGLAWAICGFAEQIEFLETLGPGELDPYGGGADIDGFMLRAARATADFYLENVTPDGIPFWDTGAPGLALGGSALDRLVDPRRAPEPVDSSAAAIAAQGLLRLGRVLSQRGEDAGNRYWRAGLTVARTLFAEPYLSTDDRHQGLLLHSVYHRPNGWDHVPAGCAIPCGESSMWGDYHARELALYIERVARGAPYLTFVPTGGQPE